MENILSNIEKSIPAELRSNLSKSLNMPMSSFLDLSNKLKSMVENYSELKEVLFSNHNDALHYSGDILAKTLHDYWIKGGCIKQIFIENAQATAFYAGFECVW
jgi:hypothetical protein